MLDIKIGNKVYQCYSNWDDLTLGEFIELSKIPIPEKLEALWVASAGINGKDKKAEAEYKKASDNITESDLIKAFPFYYGQVMELLTNIPKTVILRIHSNLRVEFFDGYLKQFVLTLIYSTPVDNYDGKIDIYKPEDISSLKIGKEEFLFPKSMHLYNDLIPMSEEKIISFAEAADIDLSLVGLKTEGISKLPVFMGIYCRKEGEEYDEKLALSRQELFKKSKMSEVWALFFYTVQLTHISQNFIQSYLQRQVDQLTQATTKKAGSLILDGAE